MGEDFQSCYKEHIQKYPTMVGFVRGKHFTSLEELTSELRDYVHWFNHIRFHRTLGNLSQIEYKLGHLNKTD